MTDRKTREGLETIFNLFIDDPDKDTLTLNNYKKFVVKLIVDLAKSK